MNVRSSLVVLCLLTSSAITHAQYSWRLILPRTSFTVQINPLDPNKLYVGNTYDQLYRSNDGGTLWERLVLSEIQTGEVLSTIVVSAVDTNVILFGGYLFDGIKRSINGGRTVRQALNDTSGGLAWFISEAIIEDPSNPHTLYAARGKTRNTIYKSTNVGLTWVAIAEIDTAFTRRLCTIAIRPDSTNILFLGATGGTIIRSDDAGRTWRQVPVLGDKLKIMGSSEIPKIVFSPVNAQVGYAVVAFNDGNEISGNGGLLKTTDGGASWNRIAYADTSLWAVEVRASSVGTDDVFIGGFRLSRAASVIKGDSVVARSLDGGTTWMRFNNITWSPNEDGETYANVWVLRYNKPSNKLYMATDCGLYVFEEPTSVSSDVMAHASLRTTITDNVLHVVDTESSGALSAWSLYNMQGATVATGRVDSSNELTLSLSGFASGAYVMTWGTESKFRTISFALSR